VETEQQPEDAIRGRRGGGQGGWRFQQPTTSDTGPICDPVHNRRKRVIAYNYDERRITFPPGTIFFLTPTLSIPFIRNLAKGYTSTMTISAPFQNLLCCRQ